MRGRRIGDQRGGRGTSQDWRGRGQLRNSLQHLCGQPGSGGPGSGAGGDILLPQAQGRRWDVTRCSNTAGDFQMPIGPIVTGSGKCGEENASLAVTCTRPLWDTGVVHSGWECRFWVWMGSIFHAQGLWVEGSVHGGEGSTLRDRLQDPHSPPSCLAGPDTGWSPDTTKHPEHNPVP